MRLLLFLCGADCFCFFMRLLLFLWGADCFCFFMRLFACVASWASVEHFLFLWMRKSSGSALVVETIQNAMWESPALSSCHMAKFVVQYGLHMCGLFLLAGVGIGTVETTSIQGTVLAVLCCVCVCHSACHESWE